MKKILRILLIGQELNPELDNWLLYNDKLGPYVSEVFKVQDVASAWNYINPHRVNTILVEPLTADQAQCVNGEIIKFISEVRSKYHKEFVFVLHTNIQRAEREFQTNHPNFAFVKFIRVNNDEEDTQYFDKLKLALEKAEAYLSKGNPQIVTSSHPENWWQWINEVVAPLPKALKVGIFTVAGIVILSFIAWKSLPDKTREGIINRFIASPSPSPSPTVTAQSTPSTTPVNPTRKRKIVILDNPLLVYPDRRWINRTSNQNDIAEILLNRAIIDLDIDVLPLSTTEGWNLRTVVFNAKPDLIIIHASCFYSITNIDDPKGEFHNFLNYVGAHLPNTKLLIYSRAFHGITIDDIHRYERASNLVGRITTFPVKGGADISFRDREVRNQLIAKVEEMLGST